MFTLIGALDDVIKDPDPVKLMSDTESCLSLLDNV